MNDCVVEWYRGAKGMEVVDVISAVNVKQSYYPQSQFNKDTMKR